MRKGIRVAVTDDHKILLGSLAAVLGQLVFIDSVETCSTYGELQQLMRKMPPDVLFLDLNMRPYNGLVICSEMRKRYPQLCIVILTSYDEQLMILEAEKSGANAYFAKSVDVEVIERFLQNYYNGVLQDFVVEVPGLKPKFKSSFPTDPFILNNKLTAREKEIFGMLAVGMNHKEVIGKLDISYDTFKTHRTNILQKLELKSTIELVQYAMINGLVHVPLVK